MEDLDWASAQNYMAVNNGGWVWTNEGTADDPKWGYVSKLAGAHMVMKVRTSLQHHSAIVT